MTSTRESSKAKMAARVIEIFEYFDEHNRSARVMDIARRYGRPQSSTSELLLSLVEMGFLYKDARSRRYTPTPRVAILGSSSQPKLLRSSLLLPRIDQLAAHTGHGVALLGTVGTSVQVFRCATGAQWTGSQIQCGATVPLCDSVAGMLLLSTQAVDRYCGLLLRRLNAEAPDDRKFDPVDMLARVRRFGEQGWAAGASGFAPQGDMIAVMLPRSADERPLALAMIYERDRDRDICVPDVLSQINDLVSDCVKTSAGEYGWIGRTPTPARSETPHPVGP
jgi:DNA-binding IclR family transcriptional regulator